MKVPQIVQNKNWNTAILVLLLLIAIILAIRIYNSFKDKKAENEETPPGGKNDTPVVVKKPRNDEFPLERTLITDANSGSLGEHVKNLQFALNRLRPGNNLKLDGDFGAKTYAALLLTIGTSIDIGGVKYSTYPVTQKVYTAILTKSNNLGNDQQLLLDDATNQMFSATTYS